jgi:hypothetical protein
MGIVEEFEELKPILQEKWLDFYSQNKSVILRYLTQANAIKYEYILGILISLEPKLSIAINNYLKICDYLRIQPPSIDVLLLNILNISHNVSTLDQQVKEREEKMKNQLIELPSPLDEFRNKNF